MPHETLQFSNKNMRTHIAWNISYAPLRDKLVNATFDYADHCSDKCIDYETEILAVWKAFSDPLKIGFLTSDRFDRLLNEMDLDYIKRLGPRMYGFGIVYTMRTANKGHRLLISDQSEMIEHLLRHNQPLLRKYGQMTKPARALRKLMPHYRDETYEAFATKWKAQNEPERLHIEIWEDVKKVYNSSHYHSDGGNLHSCMINKPHLVSFSQDCGAKAIVLLDRNNTIRSRALLWPDIYFGSLNERRPLMDRVYVEKPEYEELMFQYAAENGIVRKYHQSYTNKTEFVDTDGRLFSSHISLTGIDVRPNDSYPYMDTLTFLDLDSHTLHNNEANITEGLRLEGTNGYADEITTGIYVNGYGLVPEGDVVYDVDDNPIHIDDAVEINSTWYSRSDPDIVLLETGEWSLLEYAICTEHFEYYSSEDPNIVITRDGDIYYIDDPEIYNDYVNTEDTGEWIPREDAIESTMESGVWFDSEDGANRYDQDRMEARDRQQTLPNVYTPLSTTGNTSSNSSITITLTNTSA